MHPAAKHGQTNNLQQLRKNFSNAKWRTKCGVGIPTGAGNGIFVIEGDTIKGHGKDGIASLKRMQAERGKLPKTLMSKSPSGSPHHLHPGNGIKIKSTALAGYPGVDIKGDGGMVIAAPSKRHDGVYRWLNNLPIADPPAWLIDLTKDDAADDDARKMNGGGNEKTFFEQYGDEVRQRIPLDKLAFMLGVIPNTVETGRAHWVKVGHALKHERPDVDGHPDPEGVKLFKEFTKRWNGVLEKEYSEQEFEKYILKMWRGFKQNRSNGATGGSLYYLADQGDPNWRARYENSIKTEVQEQKTWPTLAPEALHGLAGKVVKTIEPHTESDPVALLLQLLVYFGNAIGRGVYWQIEGTKHYTNLFATLVGATSKGRKGTAADRIRQVMAGVHPEWIKNCIQGGLSSGEGLIWAIHDAITKRDKDGNEEIVDPGIDDKRLLVDEREFSRVLTVEKRDGNTLLDVIRNAWDGREYIASMTKNTKAAVTNAHISMCGHITGDELRRMLNVVAMANGYANRFLFACVRRSKYLAFGGSLEQSAINALGAELQAAFSKAWLIEKEIPFDKEAAAMWESVYRELSDGMPGLLGAICGRAEAQTRRLAVLYAVLDSSDVVKLVHLRAALALWKYCEDSARYIFGDSIGDPLTDELLHTLRNSGEMSRTQIRDLFKRNQSSDKIDAALVTLEKYGLARHEMRATGGRQAEFWVAAGK